MQIQDDFKSLSKPHTFFTNEGNRNKKLKNILFGTTAGIDIKQVEKGADLFNNSIVEEKTTQFVNVVIDDQDLELIILALLPYQYQNIQL